MIKNYTYTLSLFILSFLFGCKSIETIDLPEQTIEIENPFKIPKRASYHGSKTKLFDLIHTKLAVRFNWEKAHMYGQAGLTLTPYFYPTDSLFLNARGMNINKVQLMSLGDDLITVFQDLSYEYDSLVISIQLDKEYSRKDTLYIFIDYVSKPNELPKGGSKAIKSDKGLYFINPKGTQDKPQQIWTQGETESSSAWFPTIDSPNERTTGEIAITINNKFKTLSNGLLTHSELNNDGTRTDFWEMNLPHAPYLFMMAIGEFEMVKDKWRNIDVDYYVEPAYKEAANGIFGNTPEMIEFFSKKLGVDYPWQKYSQVVVRDYVSGAMENTTAVIHGEFVHQTQREMIDGNGAEDVIAHELFHHWFGDLVTCESWANLPLNESFATYGEILWKEYKYGDDKAAEGLQVDLTNYLQEMESGQYKDMIRFNYKVKEGMFDRHSYQKGGRILHMLRSYLGDDAFFSSLKLYLTENKFSDVEMHHFRLACEKITGEDLNWFFNQWFYAAGHPKLNIQYKYIDSLKTQVVIVEQFQDFNKVPVYKLPVDIDIYVDGKVTTRTIILEEVSNSFAFKVDKKPQLVNFDAKKMLLCEKVDNHLSIDEWVYMYHNAPRYLDRFEAIVKVSQSDNTKAIETILHALKDPYPSLRRSAIRGLDKALLTRKEEAKTTLLELAKNDRDSKVRGDALEVLANNFSKDKSIEEALLDGVSQDSYYVIEKSLEGLSKINFKEAVKLAKQLESDENTLIKIAVGAVYAEHGSQDQNTFYTNTIPSLSGFSKFEFLSSYGNFLKKQNHQTIEEGIESLEKVVTGQDDWWIRMNCLNIMDELSSMILSRKNVAQKELNSLKTESKEKEELQNSINANEQLYKKIKNILARTIENEENTEMKRLLETHEQ